MYEVSFFTGSIGVVILSLFYLECRLRCWKRKSVMRDATKEERQGVTEYIRSISQRVYTNEDVAKMLKALERDICHELCGEIHKKPDCPCTNQTTSCLALFRVCDASRAISRVMDNKIEKLKGKNNGHTVD